MMSMRDLEEFCIASDEIHTHPFFQRHLSHAGVGYISAKLDGRLSVGVLETKPKQNRVCFGVNLPHTTKIFAMLRRREILDLRETMISCDACKCSVRYSLC
jgi:hypothetical protein